MLVRWKSGFKAGDHQTKFGDWTGLGFNTKKKIRAFQR